MYSLSLRNNFLRGTADHPVEAPQIIHVGRQRSQQARSGNDEQRKEREREREIEREACVGKFGRVAVCSVWGQALEAERVMMAILSKAE